MSTSPASPGAVRAPLPQGLYDPAAEHDACGFAFVATLRGTPGRDIVDAGLTALLNLDHRGAVGAEEDSGDGAGILTQIPDAFLRDVVDAELPPAGFYAIGMAFLPVDETEQRVAVAALESIAAEEKLDVLAWREVVVTADLVGPTARASMPVFRQLVVADPSRELSGIDLDRRAYRLRKRAEREHGLYFASLSARTIAYKGMLTTGQLEPFFADLSDPRYASEIALVHSRFSTNTFPSWPLAQPFRMIAHNGEINTVRGNRNWMAAREGTLASDELGDLAPLLPVCTPGGSDSGSFDEVLELLHLSGRTLPHAVMMMIPEAWENHAQMEPSRRAFYEYHSTLMEPWDGPAAITFTDGTLIGSVQDRNGLRPGRYWVTEDGLVVCASEAGVLDIDPATIVAKGRLEPGRMFLVDTGKGRIIDDQEIKSSLAAQRPYAEWVRDNSVLPAAAARARARRALGRLGASSAARLRVHRGGAEDPAQPHGRRGCGAAGRDGLGHAGRGALDPAADALRLLHADVRAGDQPAAGRHPRGAGDRDRRRHRPGAQPARGRPGSRPQADPAVPGDRQRPAGQDRARRQVSRRWATGRPSSAACTRSSGGGEALEARLEEIFAEVDAAVADGVSFLVLSDRNSDADLAPIPSLLLLSAVHHHTLRRHTRTQISLVVEAGDVREVHHVALLIGYGAAAVNPYLAMETVEDLARDGYLPGVGPEKAVANLIKALGKGVLKVMSKMGISTIASYRGAQVFEAIGLSQPLVDKYFTGTTSRLGGIGLDVIAAEVAARHADAYPASGNRQAHLRLAVGGEYQWRRDGEDHLFDPETVFRLQHSTRTRQFDVFQQYTNRVDEQSSRLMTLRGLLAFKEGERTPVPLDEVEPVSEIVKRFNTGAMSYGSISMEAHETLAIAMNSIGGKSNTGEGGEDPERLHDPERRSAIKQIASGRFGVTSEYLTNADDIQIKLAQGAKPGEGGQLPGNKVYPWIGRTRHSTPGVGLISPPPHHDIYSIEDLAQLIHDAKNANPQRPDPHQARQRVRRRDHRGGRRQGALRRRAHLGSRRRHRREPADVAQARGHPVGDRPRGDAADPGAEQPARPRGRPGGRPAQDRPRRGDRCAAGRRGVRLRHRAARRVAAAS